MKKNEVLESNLMKNNSIITEINFIDLFANDKQKTKYINDNQQLSSSSRRTILKNSQRLCDIEYIGDKKYKISKVYKYPVPINFSKMNRGLYKYFIPLILKKLILQDIHIQPSINFSYYKWYKMIELVNENYKSMKNNIEYSAEEIDVSQQVMREYFNNTDDLLSYYFKQCIEYFKEANLFGCEEITMVCKRNAKKQVNNGVQKYDIRYEYFIATDEDKKNERHCDENVCKLLGIAIDDKYSKFFGDKRHRYLEEYTKEIRKLNIMFFYKSYKIYSTDNDKKRCEKLINSFDITNEKKLIDLLNKEFKKNMLENAKKRFDKNSYDKNRFIGIEKNIFLNNYNLIADTTLNKNSEIYDIPQKINDFDEKEIDKILNDLISITIDNKNIRVEGKI